MKRYIIGTIALIVSCSNIYAQTFGHDMVGLFGDVSSTDYTENSRLGTALEANEEWCVVGDEWNRTDLSGDDSGVPSRGAVYIYRQVGDVWEYSQKLFPADGGAVDFYGSAVSMNSERMVVGAHRNDTDSDEGASMADAGAVYIYELIGDTWEFVEKIVSPIEDREAFEYYGWAVEIDTEGDLFVGSRQEDNDELGPGFDDGDGGAVYRYEWSGTSYELEEKIIPTPLANERRFGSSIETFGDILVIGAEGDPWAVDGGPYLVGAGSAFIYRKVSDEWVYEQTLNAGDRYETVNFGSSVSVGENMILVGCDHADTDLDDSDPVAASGAAYVFLYNPDIDTWYQSQKLSHSNDRGTQDWFGMSCQISGSYAAIGSRNSMNEANTDYLWQSGNVIIYEIDDDGLFEEIEIITSIDRDLGDMFGYSVGLVNNDLIIGAYNEDHPVTGTVKGRVYFSEFNAPPVVSSGLDFGDSTLCYVDTIKFDFTVVDETPEDLSFFLSNSNPVLVPWADMFVEGIGAERELNIVPALGETGSVTIVMDIMDDAGFSYSIDFTLTINGLPDISIIETETDYCVNQEITLTGSGGITYEWEPSITNGVEFVISEPGTYTYEVEGTDVNGCTGNSESTLNINGLPEILIDSSGVINCLGDSLTLVASGGTTYIWDHGVINGVIFSLDEAGEIIYTVVGTDDNGCSNSASRTITVLDPNALTFDLFDDELVNEQTVSGTLSVLVNDVLIDGLEFGLLGETDLLNEFSLLDGEFIYTAGSLNGIDTLYYYACHDVCINTCDTALIIIEITDFIDLDPGNYGISINGDGVGDELVFEGLNKYPDNLLVVYNRWGDLVYEIEDYQNDWGGLNKKGDQLIDGTYFYVLRVTMPSGDTLFKGFVELKN